MGILWGVHYEDLGEINSIIAGTILGLCPANERCHYFVTTSLIGWAQA